MVTGTPGPASAHPPGQPIPDAAYYETTLTDVTPAPGVTVAVDPRGEWLELANTGPAVVVVLGYLTEPYLRITATTTEENQVSQTTYLNRSLFADTIPTGQDPVTPAPAWQQVAASGVARWHDHRIHWMGRGRPPMVDADPTHAHVIGSWVVHAKADSTAFDIHGALRWLGKPPANQTVFGMPRWLLLLTANVAVLVVMLAVFALWRRRGEPRTGKPPVSLREARAILDTIDPPPPPPTPSTPTPPPPTPSTPTPSTPAPTPPAPSPPAEDRLAARSAVPDRRR